MHTWAVLKPGEWVAVFTQGVWLRSGLLFQLAMHIAAQATDIRHPRNACDNGAAGR